MSMTFKNAIHTLACFTAILATSCSAVKNSFKPTTPQYLLDNNIENAWSLYTKPKAINPVASVPFFATVHDVTTDKKETANQFFAPAPLDNATSQADSLAINTQIIAPINSLLVITASDSLAINKDMTAPADSLLVPSIIANPPVASTDTAPMTDNFLINMAEIAHQAQYKPHHKPTNRQPKKLVRPKTPHLKTINQQVADFILASKVVIKKPPSLTFAFNKSPQL